MSMSQFRVVCVSFPRRAEAGVRDLFGRGEMIYEIGNE